jgi:hypothetical protein
LTCDIGRQVDTPRAATSVRLAVGKASAVLLHEMS